MNDQNKLIPFPHKVRTAEELNLLDAVALLYEKGIISTEEWNKKSNQIRDKYNEN